MESNYSDSQRDKLSADALKYHIAESIMQREDISSFFNAIEKTFDKMNQVKKQAGFLQMKNIDLCQVLNGTVFKTQLNKLCDIKQIIRDIEVGFDSLQCDFCNLQASYSCKVEQKTLYELYCKDCLKEHGSDSKSIIELKTDLRLHLIILDELERLLIRLQERIDYFNIKKNKANFALFQKFKGVIDDKFNELNIILKNLAIKCSLINQKGKKTIKSKSQMSYEDLSFIKDDCDKCRNTIFKILCTIPKVCEKNEADSLVQTIVDSKQGVSFEEWTESLVESVPDYIYGKQYQLVQLPTQSLMQFKELENKIQDNCQIIEACVEVLYFIYSKDLFLSKF